MCTTPIPMPKNLKAQTEWTTRKFPPNGSWQIPTLKMSTTVNHIAATVFFLWSSRNEGWPDWGRFFKLSRKIKVTFRCIRAASGGHFRDLFLQNKHWTQTCPIKNISYPSLNVVIEHTVQKWFILELALDCISLDHCLIGLSNRHSPFSGQAMRRSPLFVDYKWAWFTVKLWTHNHQKKTKKNIVSYKVHYVSKVVQAKVSYQGVCRYKVNTFKCFKCHFKYNSIPNLQTR